MLGQIEDIGGTSLYLELIESHGHIFLPYLIGSDMTAEVLHLEKGTSHAVAVEFICCIGMFAVEFLLVERRIRILADMICIRYLLKSDYLIMV